MRRCRRSVFLFLTLSLFVLSWSPTSFGQNLETHEITQLRIKIESRAQKDVQCGKDPENVTGLCLLFGEDARQQRLPMSEVVAIYEAKYTLAQKDVPLWRRNKHFTWLGIVALLSIVLYELGKEFLLKILRFTIETIYGKLAGFRPFWFVAVKRYIKSLTDSQKEQRLPFRQGRPLPLNDIYVPIRVTPSGQLQSIDATDAILANNFLLVLGLPGSGKSILLRRFALWYVCPKLHDKKTTLFPSIPIVLELNRLNSDKSSIEAHLTKALERQGFPRATGFIKNQLLKGRLVILFDGLDEVNSQLRNEICKLLSDFASLYPRNKYVVTCRTQVYRNEFNHIADQIVEVAEFNDSQIKQFLQALETDMPAGKSAEHLLCTLRERPQILSLARNPLLLTMISYLYTDTEFVLPHSRSEFYEKTTHLLLDQWKTDRNQYKAGFKRLVLQHLALFSQSRAQSQSEDRRSVELEVVLREIQNVLPGLALSNEHAHPMLDEIVERSGLILPVDGGVRYQFTHLTLQEFFAAKALEHNAELLLTNYSHDPDAWREVLRLWCGLERDSTYLLRKVMEIDFIMGLECLADAQLVEKAFVIDTLNELKPRLANATNDESFARAFSLIAADPRDRGISLLEYLYECLGKKGDMSDAAARVLSLTNLPDAATALVIAASSDHKLRDYVCRMGDLSVLPLYNVADRGNIWAIEALNDIATETAFQTLVTLLWSNNEESAVASAWLLAEQIQDPEVDAFIEKKRIPPLLRKEKHIEWVWAPFADPSTSDMSIVCGRIAFLLLHKPIPDCEFLKKQRTYDPRLVIPTCAIISRSSNFKKSCENNRNDWVEQLNSICPKWEPPNKQANHKRDPEFSGVVSNICRKINSNKNWCRLVFGVPLALQCELMRRLISKGPQPNIDDWKNILHRFRYDFTKSTHASILRFLLLLPAALTLLIIIIETFTMDIPISEGHTMMPYLCSISSLLIAFLICRIKVSITLMGGLLIFVAFGLSSTIQALSDLIPISSGWEVSLVPPTVSFIIAGCLLTRKYSGKRLLAKLTIATVAGSIIWISSIALAVDNGGSGYFLRYLSGPTILLFTVAFLEGPERPLIFGATCIAVAIVSMASCAVFVFLAFYPTLYVCVQFGTLVSVALWSCYGVLLFLLFRHGKRLQRRAQNPFYGLLPEKTHYTIKTSRLLSYLRNLIS